MLSSLTLNDRDGNPVTLHTEAGRAQVRSAIGLVGVAAPRESRRDRPTARGALDESQWDGGKLVVIEGAVVGTDQTDAYERLRVLTTPMVQSFRYGPATLKWTEGDSGLALQREVKLAGDVDPTLAEGASILEYQAQFFAEDPRAFSQTLVTVAGEPLSSASGGLTFATASGTNLVTNGGFEVDTAGWSAAGVTLSSDATYSYAGSRSMKMVIPGGGGWADTPVSAPGAGTYRVSVFARAATGASNISVSVTGGTGLSIVNVGTAWTQVVFTTNLEAGVAPLRIFGDGATFYIDEVSVTRMPSGGLTFPFTFARSGGGAATVHNAGNDDTPATFRIYGTVVNPTIQLEGEDSQIVLNGTVAAGDYIEVDAHDRTVRLNGTTSRNNFINSAETTFFELPPGDSTVRLTAETFDASARCDTIYRAAYS